MAVAKKSPRDLPKKADNNTAAAPQSLPKPVSSVGVSSILPGPQSGLSASEEQVRRRAYDIDPKGAPNNTGCKPKLSYMGAPAALSPLQRGPFVARRRVNSDHA